ncbi:hypothetical protein FGO68_gene11152 [Halteria grandinella]|uniref:Phosphatidic acid phosphatase type 2/haloperoxidase domain-containing protein n=1 Tax=Halteria grandinella TaxID=5974 RepID=A0A8J8T1F9_HALGN|nr:hypothetical protein FGO68_gene11152 [Halteria grandinella]
MQHNYNYPQHSGDKSQTIIRHAELFYRAPLYSYTHSFILTLQGPEPIQTRLLTKALHLLSILGEGAIYFAVFLLIYNWYSRGRAFYYLLFVSTLLTIQNVGKIGYHEPRPYMVFSDIQTVGCSYEYGQPSGHSLFSAGFAVFIFLDFFGGAKVSIAYVCGLIGSCAFFLCMGFARIYQGVHSIDQVLYGWQMGIWGALYFHFCLKDAIISHIDSGELTAKSALLATAIFALAIASQIAAYFYVDYNFQIPTLWIENLELKCSPQPLYKTFHYKSLIQAGMTPAAYTAYLGFIWKQKLFQGQSVNLQTDIGRYFLRIIVIGSLCLPFGLLYVLVPWSLGSIWLLLLLKTLLPCLGSMLLVFTFSDYLFIKLNLVRKRGKNLTVQEGDYDEPLLGEKIDD